MDNSVSRSSMSRERIPFQRFQHDELDSLSWYDVLPGDPIRIDLEFGNASAADISQKLLQQQWSDIQIDDIDLLAAQILNLCPTVSGYGQWSELAFKLSQIMSRNLTKTGSRPMRMHAQRLIYYLQSVIDSQSPVGGSDFIVSEKSLNRNKPWDFLPLDGNEWWISSETPNIHLRFASGEEKHWRFGLPTQLDLQLDGTVAVGSLYTNGAYLFRDFECEAIDHHAPVMLLFQHRGSRYFLDHAGDLWQAAPRVRILASIRPQVHFARYFNGWLYLMDNGDFGHLTAVDMDGLALVRRNILPVQVCNDLAVCASGRYLIDKQQGSVFKFDEDWQFERRILSFGRGKGGLLDPVSIRHADEKLYVVSWLNARLTEIRPF